MCGVLATFFKKLGLLMLLHPPIPVTDGRRSTPSLVRTANHTA